MFNRKEIIQVIDKLIELTQHNRINWEVSNQLPQTVEPNPNNSLIGLVYIAHYLDQKIRIYNHRYRHYYDEEHFIWEDEVVIEFIDEYGNLLATLPYSPNAYELLKVIQFKKVNFNDFYTKLLKEN